MIFTLYHGKSPSRPTIDIIFFTFSKHRRVANPRFVTGFFGFKIRHGIGDLTAPPLGDGVSWSETGADEVVHF